MRTHPVIGILGNRIPNDQQLFHGMERDYVNHDYVHAVETCGGYPLIIPVTETSETMTALLDIMDGILVSGGYDITPALYGEEPHRLLGYTDLHIDNMQIFFLKEAYRLHKPILAVCRGFQLLHVMLGGSLYQDTTLFSEHALQHMQNARRDQAVHSITLSQGSLLHTLFGDRIMVNSFHHLCIKQPGNGLRMTAEAPDGIPEAAESADPSRFVVGVQWHPEMMLTGSDSMKPLFSSFIEAASG